MTKRAQTFRLALLLPLLLSAAALARDPGGVFQIPVDGSGSEVSAAMDDEGGFAVSWVSNGYDVEARRFHADGQPAGGDFQVGQVTATYSGPTSVTLDRSGFLVVWDNYPKYSPAYFLGQRFDRDGHPLLAHPFGSDRHSQPDVHSDPKGNSVIVSAGPGAVVATRRNAAGRRVGRPIVVAARGRLPEVAVDAAGNFVVAWNDERTLYVRRFGANGAPRSGAVKVASVAEDFVPPSLAGNREGRFAVAWHDGTSLRARLYSSSGEPRTGPVLVSGGIEPSSSPSVAMDAEGKVLVSWSCCYNQGTPARDQAVYGRWFDSSGAPSGGVFRISSANRPGTGSEAAAGPKNRFLVVWHGTADTAPPEASSTIVGRRLAFARPGDDPCLLRRGSFVCDTAHDGGEEELSIPFRGPGSDIPLLGDLDGDGDDDPCRYRPGRFLCDTAHDGGAPELEIAFGLPGDIPLLGDLDGEGRDDACVYRGSQLLCDTAHNGGTAEVIVPFNPFGHPLVLPFLADVDGDGDDDPCLARNGQLLCDREHDGGPEDLAIPVDFGAEGDVLLLGDVNNDNRADPCVHRDGRFRCDTRRDGSADLIIPFSFRGAVPLLGNVDGI